MVQLAKLKNLSTLNICSPRTYSLGAPSQGIIDDGIIRAWSRCAADEGAFPLLRVLKLRHQRELTPRCIDYLNAFPVLNIFCVSEFSPAMPQKTKRKADKWGWKCLTEDDLGLFYPKPTDSIHNRPQYEDEYLPRTPCPVYVPSRQPCNALEILLFNPGAARAAFEMLRQCCCPDCPSSLNTYSEDPNLRTAPPTLSILFGTDEAFHPWLWGFLCFYRHNKHSEDSARSLKRKAGKDLASGSSGTAGAELDATGISRPSADGVPPQKGRKMRNLKGHSNESLLKLFQG
ncbi:hypothetical protein L228DRAFT_239852 [Xylona heveae TC161]|uniref:Uncharacterized protein n=1 Tax=Xylona heveae (strain CBS 132557 / TC161) TaxID=1328760 RepID=A0A165G9Y6_XYLHT|nr:hypothetical protein L228DRAFT_239852 [Xylona heveae TC161]KZF21926.1 hypothetical protein L228DRAFT_239852 [Xylona heveae TC161]